MDRETRTRFHRYVTEDLAAFNDWREWSPQTMASYVLTLLVNFERGEPPASRDPRRYISRAKQRRISEKIRVLRHEGYPQRQAIAIAYRMEGVARRARDPQ